MSATCPLTGLSCFTQALRDLPVIVTGCLLSISGQVPFGVLYQLLYPVAYAWASQVHVYHCLAIRVVGATSLPPHFSTVHLAVLLLMIPCASEVRMGRRGGRLTALGSRLYPLLLFVKVSPRCGCLFRLLSLLLDASVVLTSQTMQP